jgi:hypothetical protein
MGFFAWRKAYSTTVRRFSLHRMMPMDGFSSSCLTWLSKLPLAMLLAEFEEVEGVLVLQSQFRLRAQGWG